MKLSFHLHEIGSMEHRQFITSDVAAGVVIPLSLAIIAVAGWLAFVK